MARYGQAFKDKAVARLLPPESSALEVVAREVGVGAATLGRPAGMITKQSATGFHSGASVKAEIYREANDFCVKQGLQFQLVRDNAKDGVPGYAFANAEVVYRCLIYDDRKINRPTPMPNVIIENRNR